MRDNLKVGLFICECGGNISDTVDIEKVKSSLDVEVVEQFENLCFLHEDIAFRSQDWGDIIEKKLQDPNCGIIGFTGSPIKFKSLSSTHPSARLMINHYILLLS